MIAAYAIIGPSSIMFRLAVYYVGVVDEKTAEKSLHMARHIGVKYVVRSKLPQVEPANVLVECHSVLIGDQEGPN